uniref:Putative homing endonuclease n=1 Tax=viral metagenome TaxID=1070528 RepID=A0A6M3LXM7_9ZZZZ
MNNQILVRCRTCNQALYLSINAVIKGTARKYCSRICYVTWKTTTSKDNPGQYFKKDHERWYVYWRENGTRTTMPRARWVWEQANGPIPDGYVVHHKDENKENDSLDNLELMTREDHTFYHRFMDSISYTLEQGERIL